MIPTSPRFALLGIIFAGFSEYPPSNMTTQQMLTGLNCICETTELKIQDCTCDGGVCRGHTLCRGRPFADENLSVRAVSYEHEGRAVQLVHLAVASAALARSYSSYICSGVLQQLVLVGTVYLLSPLHG